MAAEATVTATGAAGWRLNASVSWAAKAPVNHILWPQSDEFPTPQMHESLKVSGYTSTV